MVFFPSLVSCVILKPVISDTPSKDERSTPSQDAYYYTLLGLQYEEADDAPAALKAYLSALNADPHSLFLLNRIASISMSLGKLDNALRYAESAKRLAPHDIKTLHLIGEILVAYGKAEDAKGIYGQIIKIEPQNAEAYFKLAEVFSLEKNLEKAEAIIKQAIALHLNGSLGYYYLGKMAIENNSPEKGLAYFLDALTLNPRNVHLHLEIAALYETQGKSDEAKNVYRHILDEIYPGNKEAATKLISLLIRDKSWDEALTQLDDFAKYEPLNLNIPLQSVLIWVEKKAYAHAIEKLLPVIYAKPGDRHLQRYLASLYEENNEYDKAIAIYQTMLDGEHAYDIRLRLGALYYYKLNNTEEALAQGALAKKSDPKKPQAYIFTGRVLHHLKRYEEAAQALIEGIDQGANHPDLHFHLGATYDKLSRFEDVVEEMEKTIQLDANHADALNYLGYTFVEKGMRLDDAVVMIKRALIVRPDDGYFVDSLGWAFYKKGMIQDALTTLKRAVSLAPEDPVIHEHLGEVYLQVNERDLAREAWNHSLQLDPKNEKLAVQFKEAGFESPPLASPPKTVIDLPQHLPTESQKINQTLH